MNNQTTLHMPQIIYGTAWKKERTAELVVQAIQAGFRGVDTACQPKHYKEEGVGEALQRVKKFGIERESLYIQTKFTPLGGQDPNNTPYDKSAPLKEQVEQSFEATKRNLQSSYVDALILHSPLFPFSDLLVVWQAMQDIYKRGEALRLGISNCYDVNLLKKLYETSDIKPSIVQNRFYNETSYDKELREFCREKNIAYQSFWSLTANPFLLAHQSLRAIAQKYAKNPEEIFFRFLTHIGITPLSGTTSQLHMQQDVAIFAFELTNDEIMDIQKLLT